MTKSIAGFDEVPTFALQILVIISAVIQTVLFCYHFRVHEWNAKNEWWIDLIGVILLIFFVTAIVITSIGYSWTIIDLTIHSFENAHLQYIIYYIGTSLLFIGNALFIWVLYYLNKGTQSPWFNNDISLSKIDINVKDLTVKIIKNDEEKQEVDTVDDKDDKLLIQSGPFGYCRHPLIPILLVWEFGYGLATGAWFEFLAFIAFVSIELIHINTIEKSLLLKYGDQYYQYMQDKNAFLPGKCSTMCCEMGVYRNACVCLCMYSQYDTPDVNPKKEALLN
eukprot:154854_1